MGTTARNSLTKLVAGVSTRANLISYFNSNADIIDAALAKCNWDAGALDPDADNDDGEGYAVGSRWHTTTAIWECVDASTGAAVWHQVWPALTTELSGSITNAQLAGAIADGKLASSYLLADGSRALSSSLLMAQIATPAAPEADYTKIYTKSDGKLYRIVNGGSEIEVGASITDHGALSGLSDDDHPQYIKHSLATAENDFLIASGSGAFVKKTLAETQAIIGTSGESGVAFWADFPGTPARISDTSFSVTDTGNTNLYDKMFDPGTIIRWEKSGGGNQFAVVTAASYSSDAVTYTILGNTLSAGFSAMKFCIHKAMQDVNILPGTCPLAAETGIGKTFLLPYDIYVFGARLRYGTAATTTGGTWDVNDDGTSIFTTKPTIAASATMGSWQVADCLLSDALTPIAADSLITTDYDSGHASTPGADAYVRLLFMPVSWRYRA